MFETICSYSGVILLFLCTILLGLIYQFVLRTWFYFSDRNVKFERGLPLLGSTYKSVIGVEPAAISFRRCYDHFPGEKFIGIYDFGGQPSYLIRDPGLIQQIMITDFDRFVNSKFVFENKTDLFSHNSFGLQGLQWHQSRCTVNPAISGSRMRTMHSLMIKSSEQFIETLKQTTKTSKLFDSRDLFSRYANDIIAAAAFGIEINSMQDVDNNFFKAGSSLNEFRYVDGLKFLASLSFPSLGKFFDFSFNDEKNVDFIQKIVKENIESRKKQNTAQNDMIDLLIKAQGSQLHGKDDEDEDNINIGFAVTGNPIIGQSKEETQSM